MSRLEARELGKSYSGRKVIESVSLHVDSGEVVGLLGPNGAGKTTCFYMIVGLVPSDGGSVWLDDQDLTPFPMHVRARKGVGYLPQEASVFRKLSVADNLLAVLELRKDLSRRERADKMENLLQELHIEHLREQKGVSLSGGERRRVEIARALAMEPRFILLDEPFAGVDPISVIDIQRIVEHLTERNIGILITDHNVRETLGICSRAYIIGNGHTLAEGSPDDILQNQKVRDVYLGDHFRM
ncbi:lipopolysaccharide export system ATP-binding protein [Thiogranum longum]|uniref:Lipopolysaccharide export system ATP-binding protein LptB n=1 Tax=Thiogranum longum TaxID=1537524 RepID=A0A4R1H701_9GAMM|nr:LPS export ABC transporter ATP-binding protein [Thiogranum longum]TCK17557.1 lipopolysaccharide export system ATP-binding protein [Thiogranum longum]